MNGGWLKEGALEFSDGTGIKPLKHSSGKDGSRGSRPLWEEGAALGLWFRHLEPDLELTLLQKSTCHSFCDPEAWAGGASAGSGCCSDASDSCRSHWDLADFLE